MPTKKERIDIAARLRAVTNEELRLCFTEEILYGCLNNQNCLDSYGNIDEYLVLQALADLIEPEERTCRWEHIEGTWFMSECGKRYDCVIPDNFCPNCGAKVVN